VVSSVQQSGRAAFDPDTRSIAAARRFVRDLLVDWGAAGLVDDASLLVSELTTNAVVHAGTPFEVACTDLGDGVRLEVCDHYPARGLPAVPPPSDPTRPAGRGLLLCAALSSAWGVDYSRTTKTVWCRLDLPGAAGPESWLTAPTAPPPGAPAVAPVLVAVVGTDAGGVVRTWNADATELLGWAADAVRGAPLADLDAGGSLPSDVDLPDGRRWQGALTLRHADGPPVAVYGVRHPRREGPAGVGATWLLVPAVQRAVLASSADQPGGAPDGDVDAAWAAFSAADMVRLRFEEMLQRATDRACDAFEADAAYLLVAGLDGGAPRLATSGLADPPRPPRVMPPPGSAVPPGGGGLPAVYDDLPETAQVPLLVGSPMRSAVVAPLLAEGQPIGQLCVAAAHSGRYGKQDAVRLQHAADRLALSVQARRVGELTRRHRDQLGYLAEASDLLAGTLDPQMILALVAQLLVPRLAAWCALWLGDQRGAAPLSYVWHADESRLDAVRDVLDRMLAARTPPAPVAGLVAVEVPDLADAAVALPLRARSRRLGTAVLGRPAGHEFDREDLDLAGEVARRAALALDNALLYRTQLATSRALQQSLLPAALPAVPGLEIGVAYEAAGEGLDAGGDFYDVFAVDERRWRFAVGDVSGNGPEAASITGLARHALRLLARQDRPLAEAVAQLNRAILDQEGRRRFLTLLHGEITGRAPSGLRVALVVAGHPPPYLVEPAGAVRTVGTPGPLLGVLDRVGHATDTVHLAPGETLVCVTDGVLERRNGARILGENDLGRLLAGCAGLSAAATAAALRRSVVEYAAVPPRDDMAVLVLRASTPPS
jgi:serine phosphatase RsbU (regulator of sigma subunit)/anti-sigma regulatory factor (Ser/Thr protein kinase)